MRKRTTPITVTAEQVQKIFDYDPETGIFRWRRNPEYPKKWNTRYAGLTVGNVAGKGYLMVTIKREGHYLHRLAWLYVYGEWPPDQINHINRDKIDNRIANLRLADNSQNNINAPQSSVSGIKGVSWYAPTEKWRARIMLNRKEIYLGYFLTKEEAIRARDDAARKYHGEFADLIVTG